MTRKVGTRILSFTTFACAAIVAAGLASMAPARAAGFTFTFDWGDIPLCTTGYPNTVPNPTFVLTAVPAGTRTIEFRLKDLDVPSYNHGGGTVTWRGNSTITPGIFTYRSPCPPHGLHTYQWRATARDAAGRTLATATATRPYP